MNKQQKNISKLLLQIINNLHKYTKIKKNKLLNVLIISLNDNDFFNYPDEKQILTLKNLLNAFNTIFFKIDSIKEVTTKPNKDFTLNDVLLHINIKVKCFENYKVK